MKINCGPTFLERVARKKQWHKWFAWYPVRIGAHDCRWLEHIERRGTFHCGRGGDWWTWEYRA